MQVINTNVPSLNSQRNLASSGAALSTSLQRLSSGLRINSAKDDAAGLAISERFSAQIRGMDQARRNANDGVSMSQTAEGSLSKMGDMLQRVRELAVQSANATNSASDRQAINAEVGQLTSELDRMAQTTEFNGLKLLDGSQSSSVYQVGANANQTITATTANFRTTAYGTQQIGSTTAISNAVSGAVGTGAVAAVTGAAVTTSGTLNIQGGAASGSINVDVSDSAKDIADKINQQTQTGVRASARTETEVQFGAAGSYTLDVLGNNTSAQTVTFNITATNSAAGLADAVTQFNNQASKTGVTATLNANNDGLVLSSDSGANITLAATGAIAGSVDVAVGMAGSGQIASGGGVATVAGQVTLDSDKSYTLTSSGAVIADSVFGTTVGASGSVSSSLQAVSTLDVSSAANATQALRIVDSALAAVNGQRANFGALQSRFEAAVSNLSISSENLSAARSRIRDTDFASETANLSRNQILQQAGTAMLAQANQLPQQVLQLLR